MQSFNKLRSKPQQGTAARSSTFIPIACCCARCNYMKKMQGNGEPPHAPPDLFTCVLVSVQHLPQHKREEEPRAG